MLKLLRILRDRGAITAAEYGLRLAAEDPAPPAGGTPGTTPVATAGGGAAAGQQAQAAAQDTDIAVKKVLAGKWYGGSACAATRSCASRRSGRATGPRSRCPRTSPPTAPRSRIVIRRGRLVVSGDAASHLYLYAQADFNGSTGASSTRCRMRDLCADVAFDRAKAFGSASDSPGAMRLREHAVELEPGAVRTARRR
ncbi:MAG: hypothetical protein R2712_27915 [Vicinamibacterales bacterium]